MQIIIILCAMLAIVFAVYMVYNSYGRMHTHFRRIRILNESEDRLRSVIAGMYTPINASEIKAYEVSEHEFETIIFNMYDSHPDTRLIAETKWSRYLRRLDQNQFKRIQVENSPYPLGEERIIYNDFQTVSPPTP